LLRKALDEERAKRGLRGESGVGFDALGIYRGEQG